MGFPSGITIGSKVKKGQHIGYVGQLRPLNHLGRRYNFSNSMLHFEMYKGNIWGELTNKENHDNKYDFVESKPFIRRSDLLDPTLFLDKMTII